MSSTGLKLFWISNPTKSNWNLIIHIIFSFTTLIKYYLYISVVSRSFYNNQMSKRTKKIELYAPFLMGHVFPLAKVAEILQAKLSDYTITLITFQSTKLKLEKEFPKLEFVGVKPEFTAEVEREMVTLPPHQVAPLIFSAFREYFEEKKDLPELIISDFWAPEAANFARLNKVNLIVNFPNSFNLRNLLNFVSVDRCRVIEGFLVHQQLPHHPMLAPFDAILDSFRNWGRAIFHSFIGLDDPCIKPSNYEFVGLMPSRDSQKVPKELQEWIGSWKAKGKNKILYVSFGSVVTVSEVFAKKLANIFSELGHPTIWSLKTHQKLALNNPLIYHKEWLPQQAILKLPQVRAYMSHCGWGSVSEAISTKTPLICVPVFGDQFVNARTVASRNIGIQIHDSFNVQYVPRELNLEISNEKIKEAVAEVMTNNSYLQAITRLNKLSALHSAEENIVRIVRETLKFGNEHLICPKYEEATIKTGQPLSKILIKEYLPNQQPIQ